MTFLVGSVVINEENKLMPLLKLPAIIRIGVISYGIYLFHIQAIVMSEKSLNLLGVYIKLAIFTLGFGIAILVAEISYRFYKTPFLRLKTKFSSVHQEHV